MISLLITWRSRHVPASGANVSPVRRTFWISAAMPDGERVDPQRRAATRDTWPQPVLVVDDVGRRRRSMPEKSAVDSDVSATSS